MMDDFKLRHVPGRTRGEYDCTFIKWWNLQIHVVTDVKGPHIKTGAFAEGRSYHNRRYEAPVHRYDVLAPRAEDFHGPSEDVRAEVKRILSFRGNIHKQVFFIDMGNLLRHHSRMYLFAWCSILYSALKWCTSGPISSGMWNIRSNMTIITMITITPTMVRHVRHRRPVQPDSYCRKLLS